MIIIMIGDNVLLNNDTNDNDNSNIIICTTTITISDNNDNHSSSISDHSCHILPFQPIL